MCARGRGGIVLVGSTGAYSGLAHWASYAAAKSYELILGEGLWDEFRDHGVLATSYLVGSTATPTFQRIQRKLGLPFAGDFDLPISPKAPLPRTPEMVAAALFAPTRGWAAPLLPSRRGEALPRIRHYAAARWVAAAGKAPRPSSPAG